MGSYRLRTNHLSRRRVLGAGAVAAAGLGAIPLVGCGDDNAAGPSGQNSPAPASSASPTAIQKRRGGTIHLVNYKPVAHFDPHTSNSTQVHQAANFALRGLMGWKYGPGISFDTTQLETDLAESYETPDQTTYSFKLRPGVKWEDGKPFSAEDVEATLNRVRQGGADFPYKTLYDSVDSIVVLDPQTVQFKLKRPTASLLVSLAEMGGLIQQKALLATGDPKKKLVGVGPFRMTKYDASTGAVYERVAEYFKKDQPYLDGVDWQLIEDEATRTSAFRAGQLDVIGDSGPLDKKQSEPLLSNSIKSLVSTQYYNTTLDMNQARDPFRDARVREAIHLAFDRQQVLDVWCFGEGKLNGAVPAYLSGWGAPSADDLVKLPGYRPDKAEDLANARKLLAAAGFGNGLKITALTNATYLSGPSFLEFARGSLAKVGIQVEIKLLESGVFNTARAARDYDMKAQPHPAMLDPDLFLNTSYLTKASQNETNHSDAELDALLTKQSQTLDVKQRVEIIKQAEKRIRDLFIQVFTADRSQYVLYNSNKVQDYFENYGTRKRHFDAVWLKS